MFVAMYVHVIGNDRYYDSAYITIIITRMPYATSNHARFHVQRMCHRLAMLSLAAAIVFKSSLPVVSQHQTNKIFWLYVLHTLDDIVSQCCDSSQSFSRSP